MVAKRSKGGRDRALSVQSIIGATPNRRERACGDAVCEGMRNLR